jgi:hypothetical protein
MRGRWVPNHDREPETNHNVSFWELAVITLMTACNSEISPQITRTLFRITRDVKRNHLFTNHAPISLNISAMKFPCEAKTFADALNSDLAALTFVLSPVVNAKDSFS